MKFLKQKVHLSRYTYSYYNREILILSVQFKDRIAQIN
jgi:hypothetical protein